MFKPQMSVSTCGLAFRQIVIYNPIRVCWNCTQWKKQSEKIGQCQVDKSVRRSNETCEKFNPRKTRRKA